MSMGDTGHRAAATNLDPGQGGCHFLQAWTPHPECGLTVLEFAAATMRHHPPSVCLVLYCEPAHSSLSRLSRKGR